MPYPSTHLEFNYVPQLNDHFPKELVDALLSNRIPNVSIGFPNRTHPSMVLPVLPKVTEVAFAIDEPVTQIAMEQLFQAQRLENIHMMLLGDFSAAVPRDFRKTQRLSRDDISKSKLDAWNWPNLKQMHLIVGLKCLREILDYFEPDLHPITERLIDNSPLRLKELNISLYDEDNGINITPAEPALARLSTFIGRLRDLTILRLDVFDFYTLPTPLALHGHTLTILRLVSVENRPVTFILDIWGLRLIVAKCRMLQELAFYTHIEDVRFI
jgi:hypothetical protein